MALRSASSLAKERNSRTRASMVSLKRTFDFDFASAFDAAASSPSVPSSPTRPPSPSSSQPSAVLAHHRPQPDPAELARHVAHGRSCARGRPDRTIYPVPLEVGRALDVLARPHGPSPEPSPHKSATKYYSPPSRFRAHGRSSRFPSRPKRCRRARRVPLSFQDDFAGERIATTHPPLDDLAGRCSRCAARRRSRRCRSAALPLRRSPRRPAVRERSAVSLHRRAHRCGVHPKGPRPCLDADDVRRSVRLHDAGTRGGGLRSTLGRPRGGADEEPETGALAARRCTHYTLLCT